MEILRRFLFRRFGAAVVGALLALATGGVGRAQTLIILHSFNEAGDGSYPLSRLTKGADGRFYGTTSAGGASGAGTLFALNPDGTGFALLRSLNPGSDGGNPIATVTQGSDGRIYGTTLAGGVTDGGTLFALNPDGTGFTVLHTLNPSTDGSNCYAAVVQGSDGRLYGTTYGGGAFGVGVIFAINRDGTGFTVLHNLNPASDGYSPQAALVQGYDGRLYGTAVNGGATGDGTIFALNPAGPDFIVLHHLAMTADGSHPQADLVQDLAGRLYGTTSAGGASNAGTVFAINPDGSGFTVLRQLDFNADGGNPHAGLMLGGDGRLYGTTSQGGSFGAGTVFRIDPAGTNFQVLRQLNPSIGDGASPGAGLLLGANGSLYGTTTDGGANGFGTVFMLSNPGAPIISSPTSAGATVGISFTYVITATNSPASFSAVGLPGGLAVNPVTGVIAGTPTPAGIFNVTLGATNIGGTGNAPLVLTVSKGVASVALGGLSATYDGSAKSATATTAPAGLAVAITYNGSATPPTNAGSYPVVATVGDPNYTGSASGTLTVAPAVATVNISGTTQVFDGTPKSVTVTTTPAGLPVTVTYNGSPTAPASAGTYAVVATVNSTNYAGSASATLAINTSTLQILTQPVSATVVAGQTATFTVFASGPRTISYQWRKAAVNIAGATSATVTLPNAQTADAASYTVVVSDSNGSITSAAATLTVITPVTITTQPLGVTVNAGQTATFSVTATGTAPLTYQWRKNGANLSGATSATLSMTNTGAANAGTYSVVVTNAAGSVTSNDAILAVVVPPAITTQPVAANVVAGGSVTFTVVATGTAPLSYQWRRNGTAITGATLSALTLTNVQNAQTGTYTVVVTNAAGSVTSAGAVLSLIVPVAITTQPINTAANTGQTATFVVVATGTTPLTYQWRKNGTSIAGATGATFSIANAASADQGTYSVIVTNAAGSVTSADATLSVIPLPGNWANAPTVSADAFVDMNSFRSEVQRNGSADGGR